MKKVLIVFLVLILLAVPVSADTALIHDGEQLLSTDEAAQLEAIYGSYAADYGFTPILVTTAGFAGAAAEAYAADYYDSNGYPYDGVLLLVSLTEGEWYILTNGACYDRISDREVQSVGEQIASGIRKGAYYDAFSVFPELVKLQMQGGNAYHADADAPAARQKHYGRTVAICMAVGLLIGLITVGIMVSMMKSVRPQNTAADYVRPGSMHLSHSRDIYLYSHVHRTPRPKSNSSGGSRSGGGSRGGAGGRI